VTLFKIVVDVRSGHTPQHMFVHGPQTSPTDL
jgi:hypothetical protein